MSVSAEEYVLSLPSSKHPFFSKLCVRIPGKTLQEVFDNRSRILGFLQEHQNDDEAQNALKFFLRHSNDDDFSYQKKHENEESLDQILKKVEKVLDLIQPYRDRLYV